MRRTRPLLLLLAVLCLAACARDPGRRWIQASITATSVNDTVSSLHAVGAISDEKLLELEPPLTTMNNTVQAAHARLPEGGSAFDALLIAFDAAYMAYLAKMEAPYEHP